MLEVLIGLAGPVIGLVGGLVGVVVGWLLNTLSTYWRDERKTEETRRSVRALLTLEADENLKALQHFWDQITEAQPEDLAVENTAGDPTEAWIAGRYGAVATRFIDTPLPRWSHSAWESQLPHVAAALTPVELQKLHRLHSGLETLAAIRAALSARRAEDLEDSRAALPSMIASARELLFSHYAGRRIFERAAPDLWRHADQVARELVRTGNPLKADHLSGPG